VRDDVITRQPAGGAAVIKLISRGMQQRLDVVGRGVMQRRSTETIANRQTGSISQQALHYLKNRCSTLRFYLNSSIIQLE